MTSSAWRTTCARSSSAPTPRRARRPNGWCLSTTSFARSSWTSATPTASRRCSPSTRSQLELVVHTAAQPSHDWAASDPQTDFTVNANGTLNLLEAARHHAPEATFVFCSTNKVYGDLPNALPLIEGELRLELPEDHRYYGGIDTSMSIDGSTHSLFGVSKAAADLMVQEYGRYFGHADGLLSRRLPDRAQPRRRQAARLPLLSHALHGHRRRVHGVRLRRQAGARQHPLRRPRQRVPGVPRAPRARRRSTTSAAGATRTARCSRRSSCASRSPGARWTTRSSTTTASATTAGGSRTSRRFAPITPSWELRYDIEQILREIHDHNVERWSIAA